MKFWTALPYAMLLLAVVQSFYPAQNVTLSDIEVDIIMAAAVLIFEIRRSKR